MACVLKPGTWTAAAGLAPGPCSDGEALRRGKPLKTIFFFFHKKFSNDSLAVQPALKTPCRSY